MTNPQYLREKEQRMSKKSTSLNGYGTEGWDMLTGG